MKKFLSSIVLVGCSQAMLLTGNSEGISKSAPVGSPISPKVPLPAGMPPPPLSVPSFAPVKDSGPVKPDYLANISSGVKLRKTKTLDVSPKMDFKDAGFAKDDFDWGSHLARLKNFEKKVIKDPFSTLKNNYNAVSIIQPIALNEDHFSGISKETKNITLETLDEFKKLNEFSKKQGVIQVQNSNYDFKFDDYTEFCIYRKVITRIKEFLNKEIALRLGDLERIIKSCCEIVRDKKVSENVFVANLKDLKIIFQRFNGTLRSNYGNQDTAIDAALNEFYKSINNESLKGIYEKLEADEKAQFDQDLDKMKKILHIIVPILTEKDNVKSLEMDLASVKKNALFNAFFTGAIPMNTSLSLNYYKEDVFQAIKEKINNQKKQLKEYRDSIRSCVSLLKEKYGDSLRSTEIWLQNAAYSYVFLLDEKNQCTLLNEMQKAAQHEINAPIIERKIELTEELLKRLSLYTGYIEQTKVPRDVDVSYLLGETTVIKKPQDVEEFERFRRNYEIVSSTSETMRKFRYHLEEIDKIIDKKIKEIEKKEKSLSYESAQRNAIQDFLKKQNIGKLNQVNTPDIKQKVEALIKDLREQKWAEVKIERNDYSISIKESPKALETQETLDKNAPLPQKISSTSIIPAAINTQAQGKEASKVIVGNAAESQEINKLNQEIISLRSKNLILSSKVSEKENENKRLESAIAGLKNEVRVKDAEIAQLRKDNSAIDLRVKNLTGDNTTLQNEVKDKDAKIAQLQKDNVALKRQVNKLNSDKAEAIKSLTENNNKKLNKLRDVNADLVSQVKRLTEDENNLKNEISAKKAEIAQLQKDNADLVSQVKGLNEDNAKLKDEVSAKKAKIDQLNDENADLQQKNNSLRIGNVGNAERTKQMMGANLTDTITSRLTEQHNANISSLNLSHLTDMSKKDAEISDLKEENADLKNQMELHGIKYVGRGSSTVVREDEEAEAKRQQLEVTVKQQIEVIAAKDSQIKNQNVKIKELEVLVEKQVKELKELKDQDEAQENKITKEMLDEQQHMLEKLQQELEAKEIIYNKKQAELDQREKQLNQREKGGKPANTRNGRLLQQKQNSVTPNKMVNPANNPVAESAQAA